MAQLHRTTNQCIRSTCIIIFKSWCQFDWINKMILTIIVCGVSINTLLLLLQASQTHGVIDETADGAKEMLEELMQTLEDAASAAGFVSTMIETISRAITKVGLRQHHDRDDITRYHQGGRRHIVTYPSARVSYNSYPDFFWEVCTNASSSVGFAIGDHYSGFSRHFG